MTESIAHILHFVDEHLVYSQNNTNALDQLPNFNDTLNFLKDTSTTASEVIGSVFVAVQKLLLLEIQNAYHVFSLHVKISRQYYPIVLLVTIMLIIVISTVIWESYVELEEDGLD